MHIKESHGACRSQRSMHELISNRSDAIPGIYKCVECGNSINNLMEAWRRGTSSFSCSLSTLFCASCGAKLQRLGLDIAPIQLSAIDKLNLQINN